MEIAGPKGVVDAFRVRIEFGKHFPFDAPVVFDSEGRLPRDINRHVYSDGHVCLEVWPAWLAQNPGATVSTVLDGPIRNFFLSQSVFESSGYWPFGEYQHGDAGRREALRAVLRGDSTEDKDLAWRALALMMPPRRQNTCPCRSGRLYRKCHRDELRDIAASLDPQGFSLVTGMYVDMLKREEAARGAEATAN